jgi:aryl-alcohol dehydrogenase-like predicted oxidoreductase
MSAGTTFEGDDLRKWDPKFRAPHFARYLAAVERLDAFARQRWGKRVIHLALRWLLDRPGVGIALWGARKPAQLDPLDSVMDWSLDAYDMADIDVILAECVPEPIGPEFMSPPLKRPRAPAA